MEELNLRPLNTNQPTGTEKNEVVYHINNTVSEIINILSSKVLSHFYVVCFGKVRFCKHSHVNTRPT